MDFNESEARRFYGVLNHTQLDWTEIRVKDPKTENIILQTWTQGEKAFIDAIRPYADAYTVWVGLNPRKEKGIGKNENVARRTAILVDLDIHHPDKTPATDEELEVKLAEAEAIINKLVAEGHPRPWVDVSGNGVHLIPIVNIPSQPDVRDRILAFFKTLNIVVDDANADLARMCRVPGTMNVDAGRRSYMVTPGDWTEDKALEAYLTSTGTFVSDDKRVEKTDAEHKATEESIKKLRHYRNTMRPCIRQMLTNENPGATSEKGHLDHEAHLLIVKDAQYRGLGEAEICALFTNQPDYKESTTADYVRGLMRDNNRLGVTAWYCPAIIERGWCLFEEPELCMAMQTDPNLPKTKKLKEVTDKGAALIKFAKERAVEFFRDQYQTGYVVLRSYDTNDTNDANLEKNGLENEDEKKLGLFKTTDVSDVSDVKYAVPLNSRQFKWWIAKLYHEKTHETVSQESIKAASLVLEADTQTQPINYLYNRFAPGGNLSVWWDMCDPQGRAIHVDENGWTVSPCPTKLFRRYPHMMPLPEPEKGGTLEPFLDYLNLEEPGDKLLAVVDTITTIIPEVPRAGTVITGIQGSGKSTWHRLSQNLLDPASTDLLTLPTKDEDLIQILDHHAVALFDNVNQLSRTQSDILCRAITGAGNEKRELYTTDDSFIRSFIRAVGINGISMPVEKSDLFSRMILLPWESITERKTDAEMKDKIKKDAPKLIGAILDTLVQAMKLYPTVETKLNVRMSDFAKWGCAVTIALGLKQGVFEKAYLENIKSQDEEAVRASMVAEMIIRYMKNMDLSYIEGSATDLKKMMENFENPPDEHGKPIGDLLSKREGWPKNNTRFGRELSEVATSLTAIGYKVTTPKKGRGKNRNYTIEKIKTIEEAIAGKGQRSFETTDPEELTIERLRQALKNMGGSA